MPLLCQEEKSSVFVWDALSALGISSALSYHCGSRFKLIQIVAITKAPASDRSRLVAFCRLKTPLPQRLQNKSPLETVVPTLTSCYKNWFLLDYLIHETESVCIAHRFFQRDIRVKLISLDIKPSVMLELTVCPALWHLGETHSTVLKGWTWLLNLEMSGFFFFL